MPERAIVVLQERIVDAEGVFLRMSVETIEEKCREMPMGRRVQLRLLLGGETVGSGGVCSCCPDPFSLILLLPPSLCVLSDDDVCGFVTKIREIPQPRECAFLGMWLMTSWQLNPEIER